MATKLNEILQRGARAASRCLKTVVHDEESCYVQSSPSERTLEAGRHKPATLEVIEPPYDPEALCELVENSNTLRSNLDAYASNIDSHGVHYEPVIDFAGDDADERVARAIMANRVWLRNWGRLDPGASVEPSTAEVGRTREQLVKESRLERSNLDSWTECCCADESLIAVRRRTRLDIEAMGNGYWEILRNLKGEICHVSHMPGYTMRITGEDDHQVPVQLPIKVSDIHYQTVPVFRRFCRYVQLCSGRAPLYFKELGDPRIISRTTGRPFEDLAALKRSDDNDAAATEVLHFKVHCPRSAYGAPRWIGTLLEVLGSRNAAEVNWSYFENKSIPPLALLVSGATLPKGTAERIERFVEEHVKGKQNFHKMLIVEAEPAKTSGSSPGRVSLDFKQLTDAQQQDALFQHYDERNIDKIGASFRLPRLLRGDIRDFNRSTASAAMHLAEEQVFQPERQEFDYVINRRLLSTLR